MFPTFLESKHRKKITTKPEVIKVYESYLIEKGMKPSSLNMSISTSLELQRMFEGISFEEFFIGQKIYANKFITFKSLLNNTSKERFRKYFFNFLLPHEVFKIKSKLIPEWIKILKILKSIDASKEQYVRAFEDLINNGYYGYINKWYASKHKSLYIPILKKIKLFDIKESTIKKALNCCKETYLKENPGDINLGIYL